PAVIWSELRELLVAPHVKLAMRCHSVSPTTNRAKIFNLAESMKRYALRLTFGSAVTALGILTSCTAPTTRAFRSPNQAKMALPTGVEIRDRYNFCDES